MQLIGAFVQAFPDTPPYGGSFDEPAPHLTVAKSPPLGPDPLRLQDDIARALRPKLPLVVEVDALSVMEARPDGSCTPWPQPLSVSRTVSAQPGHRDCAAPARCVSRPRRPRPLHSTSGHGYTSHRLPTVISLPELRAWATERPLHSHVLALSARIWRPSRRTVGVSAISCTDCTG